MTDFNKNFKKFLLTENADPDFVDDDSNPDTDFNTEMIDRMEGLVNMVKLSELQADMRIVSTLWMEEGFDKEDIKTYMNNFIDNI